MAAAQEKHSKPGPLKLVTPPKPCQRPIGTSASNSISSDVRASSSVFGQLISSTPSMVEMAQPRSRLVPKVPSLSLRSLNTGLVSRRSRCSLACTFMALVLVSKARRQMSAPGAGRVPSRCLVADGLDLVVERAQLRLALGDGLANGRELGADLSLLGVGQAKYLAADRLPFL